VVEVQGLPSVAATTGVLERDSIAPECRRVDTNFFFATRDDYSRTEGSAEEAEGLAQRATRVLLIELRPE
jgi:hypothetical protein